MKKSIEERVKAKLLYIGKKKKNFRALVFPVLFFVMFFFCTCKYLRSNKKRLAMLAMSCLLFTVFSSFSFPSFIMGQEAVLADLEMDGAEYITLARESELDMDQVELLDDSDVLEASDYSETAHKGYLIDKYDALEILESTGSRDAETRSEQGDDPAETDSPENGANLTFSRDDWRLVLINKQNSIPDDYTFTLGTIKGSMQCDERIIKELLDMLQAAKEDGVNLTICSPYRDMERQKMLFERKIKRYMKQGMSYMEAYQLSSEAVTVPGASEHQIGLALDIVCNEYTSLDEGFGETEAGKWLAENSCQYGFILRYPLGKEYITGIEYEPWHFRYVGRDAATLIMEQGITLEEFWEEYL